MVRECIPSSTFPSHRPHLRGPNGRRTSCRGRIFSRTDRAIRPEGNTSPWFCRGDRTTVVAGSVSFSMMKEETRRRENSASFCRRVWVTWAGLLCPVKWIRSLWFFSLRSILLRIYSSSLIHSWLQGGPGRCRHRMRYQCIMRMLSQPGPSASRVKVSPVWQK